MARAKAGGEGERAWQAGRVRERRQRRHLLPSYQAGPHLHIVGLPVGSSLPRPLHDLVCQSLPAPGACSGGGGGRCGVAVQLAHHALQVRAEQCVEHNDASFG